MAPASTACTHRPPCPGCPRLFETGYSEATETQLAALAERAGISLPELTLGDATGFRHRARLSIRGRAGSPKVGIFQADSHRIVDIPNCLVHHPLINQVVAALKRAIRSTNTAPYADGPHRGDLRNVQIVVERSTHRAQVVLVSNHDDPQPVEPLLTRFANEVGEGLHSLWWNGNPERTNTILGPHWKKITGQDAVVEEIGGAQVFYPPGAFGQSNLGLADRMIAEATGWIPEQSRVAEFYAGCGAMGLGWIPKCAHVAFNEIGDGSLEGLAQGIDRLPATLRERTSVHRGSATQYTDLLDNADVVVADPPRRGLDPALLQALCDRPPTRFIYVSCGLEALLRDANLLLDSGKLRLRALSTYALVRHSDHVETLVIFDRISATLPTDVAYPSDRA